MRRARGEAGSVSLGNHAPRNRGARLRCTDDGTAVLRRLLASPRSQQASGRRRLAPRQLRGCLWSDSDSQRSVVWNRSRTDGTCWLPLAVRT